MQSLLQGSFAKETYDFKAPTHHSHPITYTMSRCVAYMCCSVLQCVAVCCSVLQCGSTDQVLCCRGCPSSATHSTSKETNFNQERPIQNQNRPIVYQQRLLITSITCTHLHILSSFAHVSTQTHALQYTATHCKTLQHTATHCHTHTHILSTSTHTYARTAAHYNTLQHTATHCNTNPRILSRGTHLHVRVHTHVRFLSRLPTYCAEQRGAASCNTQQHTAPHCNRLQHTAAHCNNTTTPAHCAEQRDAASCNTPQRTATHCNALQHTAAYYNTLQHITTLLQHQPIMKEKMPLMPLARLVGSLKLQVSFAEYSLFYRALLQKRRIILRSLLMVATPYDL